MKIVTTNKLKSLKGTDLETTVGEALGNILATSKKGGKMKMFIMGQKLTNEPEVELDEADLALIKSELEISDTYNVLVTGQLLVLLNKNDK